MSFSQSSSRLQESEAPRQSTGRFTEGLLEIIADDGRRPAGAAGADVPPGCATCCRTELVFRSASRKRIRNSVSRPAWLCRSACARWRNCFLARAEKPAPMAPLFSVQATTLHALRTAVPRRQCVGVRKHATSLLERTESAGRPSRSRVAQSDVCALCDALCATSARAARLLHKRERESAGSWHAPSRSTAALTRGR